MADYLKDKYFPGYEYHNAAPSSNPNSTRRVQQKVTRTTTFDFGPGPYTVEDFKDFYEQIKDLPEGVKCNIQYYDSQRDGQSLKITVTQ